MCNVFLYMHTVVAVAVGGHHTALAYISCVDLRPSAQSPSPGSQQSSPVLKMEPDITLSDGQSKPDLLDAEEALVVEKMVEEESSKHTENDEVDLSARPVLLQKDVTRAIAEPLAPPTGPPAYDPQWTPGAWAGTDVKVPVTPPAYSEDVSAAEANDQFSDCDDEDSDKDVEMSPCSIALQLTVRVFRAFAFTMLFYVLFCTIAQTVLQIWSVFDARGVERFLHNTDGRFHHHDHNNMHSPASTSTAVAGPVELEPAHHNNGHVHSYPNGLPPHFGRPRPMFESPAPGPLELPHIVFGVVVDGDIQVELRKYPAHSELEVVALDKVPEASLLTAPQVAYAAGENSKNEEVSVLRPLMVSFPSATAPSHVVFPLDTVSAPLPTTSSLQVVDRPATLLASLHLPIPAGAPLCPRRFAHEVSKVRATLTKVVQAGGLAAQWNVEGTQAFWAVGTGAQGDGVEVWVEIEVKN
ncbi:hypothetical protein HDU93_006269 [Gonapodya sp. JEL0774]|nr:hypothetical protein HDU93_006269 [Gonapodya sp. JEL0774]